MRYLLCSYRKTRNRGIDACTADAMEVFARLGEIEPEIFRWKNKGASKKAALDNACLDLTDPEVVKSLLLSGRNRTDTDRTVIPELGYGIDLWNGNPDDSKSASISFLNDCHAQRVPNAFVLKFPEIGALPADRDLAARLISIATHALDAEMALLYRTNAIAAEEEMPFLDIAIYISRNYKEDKWKLRKIRKEAAVITELREGYLLLA